MVFPPISASTFTRRTGSLKLFLNRFQSVFVRMSCISTLAEFTHRVVVSEVRDAKHVALTGRLHPNDRERQLPGPGTRRRRKPPVEVDDGEQGNGDGAG